MSNTYGGTSGSRTADWLLESFKKNPEGLLLLGAGCALLFRSARSHRATQSDAVYRGYGYDQRENTSGESGSRTGSSAGQWAHEASRAAGTAREYVSSAGKALSDTAAGYAATVSEYAEGTRQQVLEQSRRVADQAQSTVHRVVQGQPFAVALAGIAAGAAVAAAFPATRWERRTLGPAGRQLSEAAQEAAQTARERVTEAASVAGERLMSAAQQRGLNAEGLKEVARDVAGAVTGEQKSSGASDRPTGSQSVTGSQGSSTQSGSSRPGQR